MVVGDPKWARYHAAGHPTYHVNVVKLKWEIIWTGVLSHLSGLPHLPGVPHLHVNRHQRKTLLLGTNSHLPFGVNMTLNPSNLNNN